LASSQPLPKYIQISERLIREIAAGHIADGARLPPEREMAADLGIAVGTLRKALGDLAPVPDWVDARFNAKQGTPVGYIERIGRTSEGSPEEFSRTWFDMDRARYVSRVGKG